ncbi:hypothetical protein NC651_008005 [Populus alba x Populus x berolinensis]|nr:hypothetical protein NC651_008005 [Populus alba x Populus x berolinensis]
MVAPSISALNENVPAGYRGLVPGHNHGPWRSSPPYFRVWNESLCVMPLKPLLLPVGFQEVLYVAYLLHRCHFVLYLQIAKAIGNPMRYDDPTTTMSWLYFARVMIEVNLSADLIHFIKISLLDGTNLKQRVIYEYLQIFCTKCHLFGHTRIASLNNSTSTEAHPNPGMTKKMHVAEAGSGDAVRWRGKYALDSGNVIDDPSTTDDPPQDTSLLQSKRPYMSRSKRLLILSDTLISVVNIAGKRPGRSRQGAFPLWMVSEIWVRANMLVVSLLPNQLSYPLWKSILSVRNLLLHRCGSIRDNIHLLTSWSASLGPFIAHAYQFLRPVGSIVS